MQRLWQRLPVALPVRLDLDVVGMDIPYLVSGDMADEGAVADGEVRTEVVEEHHVPMLPDGTDQSAIDSGVQVVG
jgi:hypothetical protein